MTIVAANGNTEAPKKNVTTVSATVNAEAPKKNVTTVTANGNTENPKNVATVAVNGDSENGKKNRIQVSNTKKPLFFYVNLAKRYIQQHSEVELSALGMAIATVVTIAEILKNNGLAIEKRVSTSTVGMKDETKGRLVHKAKIEIVLGKSEKFDTLVAPATKTASDPAAPSTKKG